MNDNQTVAHVLGTVTAHAATIMSSRPRDGAEAPYSERDHFGLGVGYGEGCPSLHIEVVILPCDNKELSKGDRCGVWATVFTRPGGLSRNEPADVYDGTWTCHGNRHGGVQAFAKMCAPVVSWVAQQEAQAILDKRFAAVKG